MVISCGFDCVRSVMVARSPNSERKMHDELPDVNVAAEFYALYDIREVLGKLVFMFFWACPSILLCCLLCIRLH